MVQTRGIFQLLLIVVLLLECPPLLSQFSFSIHYTVNDGLPSSKVYDMIQDSKGYIWFATENGVSRYNGTEFKNFTTVEGLPTNSTLKLYEDFRGRIWFLSYRGSVSYLEEDRIVTIPVEDYLPTINLPFMASIYVDSTEAVWLSPFNGGLYRYDEYNGIEMIFPGPIIREHIYFYIMARKYGHILAYLKPGIEGLDSDKEIIQRGKEEYLILFESHRSEHHYEFAANGPVYFLSFGRKLYQVDSNRIVERKTYDKEIVSIDADAKNNIWISEKFNGVYQFQGDIRNEPENHFLRGNTVSNVLLDREGNYWFSTTENGVYFVPSLSLVNHSELHHNITNNNILTLDLFENKIFFSTDGKELYHAHIVDGNLVKLRNLDVAELLVNNVYSLHALSEEAFLATADPSMELLDQMELVRKDNIEMYTVEYGYDLEVLFNGDVALSHTNGLKIFRGRHMIYNAPDHINLRVFTLKQAPDSTLWLGTLKGLFRFDDRKYELLFSNDTVLTTRISDLEYLNGKLWVGSFDHGLALVEDNVVYHFDRRNGLSSNRIKCIYPENDSLLWVGTNRGLNRIQILQGPKYKIEVSVMNFWDGLPSNEINKIGKYDQLLWLATDNGLVSFDPQQVNFDHAPPQLYISRAELEGWNDSSTMHPTDLDYNQNTLTFHYDVVCFRDPKNVMFYYRLEGLDPAWKSTNNPSVRYHDLQPGDYTFVVRAEIFSGLSSEEVRYPFRIKKHYSQTYAFQIVAWMLFAAIVGAIIYYILYDQRKRSRLQRQIYLAEQKAMLSQMNPHFVFNSLNSIQNFILDNDSENANNYLVTFSALIRRVLDISQKNFISLQDELDTVRLYLELEKFRFSDQFDYQIEVGVGIQLENIMIPSLILQPYLENAIWHGIVPKNDHGLLQLIINSDDQNNLVISIRDDGIGRERAAEIGRRRKHHKPTGIRNVEERLQLLNRLHKTNMGVKITDLYDADQKASGTLVEIFLDG